MNIAYLWMVVAEKLQAVLKTSDAVTLHENAVYGFLIKSIRSAEQGFTLLFTEGLSKNAQPVDEKNQQLQHIELYFLLPDYWDFSKKNWPVYWLNRIAEVPQKNKTWFGNGDTLPAGNPPEFVDEQLACAYFILSEPLLLAPHFKAENAGFHMLAVIPIFEREFNYKMQNSANTLFKIFEEKKVTELIDLYRNPVARKKFMGMF